MAVLRTQNLRDSSPQPHGHESRHFTHYFHVSETPYVPVCSDVEFYCSWLNKCMPNYYKCDGLIECPDGSDEPPSCRTTVSTTTTSSSKLCCLCLHVMLLCLCLTFVVTQCYI